MSYAHKITGGKKIRLKDFDPEDDGGLEREEAEQKLAKLTDELVELQELLYAASQAGSQTGVLIVLQGMDTSGKDGTIRLVMGPLNSQGCEVASFKVPTAKELAHDFLWRIHAETPERGQIKIFNRSHYEDVLVVRVLRLAGKKVWKARYRHINNFEKLLADSGTVILKFYLHISSREQEKRLLEREEEPEKYWKLSVDDWKNRELWADYMAAYEDAINRCSAEQAPWHIVPADKKWFRNLAVAEAVVEALRPYKKQWLETLGEVGKKEKVKLEEFRKSKTRS
ncbi:MAG TPA: PPK2 family polyphosphate kinase [Blastocatellia bacterium]|nr:PPK2 family polyphosphate kinase [Blastocatellia bacterium]